jgi:hypothetical protein
VIIKDLYKTGSRVAYFYCDFGDANKQHAHGLLSSLIMQLTTHSASGCDIASGFYLEHHNGSQQPDREALLKCFVKILQLPGLDPTYIVIDALDECPTSGIPSSREEILGIVQEIVDLGISNLHICLTSRPEHDIYMALQLMSPCCVCLDDEQGQVDDIAAYVYWVIETDAKFQKWRASDKKLVIETLSQKAHGM